MKSLEPAVVGATPLRWTRARRPSVPALRLPRANERRRAGVIWSILIHAFIILVLVGPFTSLGRVTMEQGAGGRGPAGGGGGGHLGGGALEHVAFVRPARTAEPAVRPTNPSVATPASPSVPTPPPPVVEPKTPATLDEAAHAAMAQILSAMKRATGSGDDGSTGIGPGSNGGTGSGVAMGRGSGIGAATGGGPQTDYPPTPTSLFVAPMPVPRSIRGVTITATFDVDSTGRVLAIAVTPTGNTAYDKFLSDAFRAITFRPATKPDGTPIRARYTASYSF